MMSPTFGELIRKEEGVLRRLAAASIRQLEIVRSGDMTRLLELLAQKQRLMDEFDAVKRQLVPFRDIPPSDRRWRDDEERRETGAAVNRCTRMLEEILRNDRRSTEELAERKTDVEEQLRRIRQGAQVNASYAKQTPEGNILRFQIDS